MEARKVTAYGLVGPTIRGIKWFATPEQLAAAASEYPNSKIRLNINGRTTHGTAEEVAPVFEALNRMAAINAEP